MIRVVLAGLLLAFASPGRSHAEDFERETRWRTEVVPASRTRVAEDGSASQVLTPCYIGGEAEPGLIAEHARVE